MLTELSRRRGKGSEPTNVHRRPPSADDMREVVSLHVGEAGAGIGRKAWEKLGEDHGVDLATGLGEGHVGEDGGRWGGEMHQGCLERSVYFEQGKGVGGGTASFYFPRALWVDAEPQAMQQHTKGMLLREGQQVWGRESAAGNFARGLFEVAPKMADRMTDQLRCMVERCSALQGFSVFHSVGGGTGSALASLLLAHLADEYPKLHAVSFTVFPSPNLSSSTVEPYNAVLTTAALLHQSNLVCNVLNNESVYHVCRRKLRHRSPQLADVNRIMAMPIHCLLGSFSAGGMLNMDFTELYNNLVPHRKLHFLSNSFAPLFPGGCEAETVYDLSLSAFHPSSGLSGVHMGKGQFMACALLYRGCVGTKDAEQAVSQLREQRRIRFVDWSPTAVKISINTKQIDQCSFSQATSSTGTTNAQAEYAHSVGMLGNHTGIRSVLHRERRKFEVMFSKRAFVHWFQGEGLEVDELESACADVATLEGDYLQAEGHGTHSVS